MAEIEDVVEINPEERSMNFTVRLTQERMSNEQFEELKRDMDARIYAALMAESLKHDKYSKKRFNAVVRQAQAWKQKFLEAQLKLEQFQATANNEVARQNRLDLYRS